MTVADENTPADTARRATPKKSKRKLRKTAEFSVSVYEHQEILLESLQERYTREPLRWKRTRLSWMMRRLNAAMEVNRRKRHAR